MASLTAESLAQHDEANASFSSALTSDDLDGGSDLTSLDSDLSSLTSLGDLSDYADSDDGHASKKRKSNKQDENYLVGRDGKAYLAAGLYSSAFKQAALPLPTEGARTTRNGATYQAIAEASSNSTFPLPINHGEYLLGRQRDFLLSFDILRDFYHDPAIPAGHRSETTAEREKREQSRKPKAYGKISRNVFVERKPEKSELPAICQCKLPADAPAGQKGCGEGCINRLMQYSCEPKTCPMGERCSNVPLRLREDALPEGQGGLRVIWTGNRGFGLKTCVPLKKGQFVIEYRGEIISRDESYRRVLNEYKDAKSYYFLDYDGHEVIDAGRRGNPARFINHSCGPNVEVVRWRLSDYDEYQIGIFALHDIETNTELTYDYGYQDFASIAEKDAAKGIEREPVDGGDEDEPYYYEDEDPDKGKQRCYCGSPACSGWLGKKKKADAPAGRKVVKKLVVKKKKQRKVVKPAAAPAAKGDGRASAGGAVAMEVETTTTVTTTELVTVSA